MRRLLLFASGVLAFALARGSEAQPLHFESVEQAYEADETAYVRVVVRNGGSELQPGFAVQIVVNDVVRGSFRGARPVVAPRQTQEIAVPVNRSRFSFGGAPSVEAVAILRGPDGRGPELDRQTFTLYADSVPPEAGSAGAAPPLAIPILTVPIQIDSFEAMPVWRLQLTTTTCGDEEAGTTGDVWVRFAPPPEVSVGSGEVRVRRPGQPRETDTPAPRASQLFVLNGPGLDTSPGATHTFDVVLPGIRRVSDIQHIEIGTQSDDDWCLSSVELRVNARGDGQPRSGRSASGEVVFAKQFRGGTWIRNERAANRSVVVATSEELRASPTWNLEGTRSRLAEAPRRFSGGAVASVIAGILGDAMSPRGELSAYDWNRRQRSGTPWVRIDGTADPRPNAAVVSASLSTVEKRRVLRDRVRQVDLRMTLVATCPSGRLRLDVESGTLEGRRNIAAFFNPLNHFGGALSATRAVRNSGGRSGTFADGEAGGGAPCDGMPRFQRDGTLILFPN